MKNVFDQISQSAVWYSKNVGDALGTALTFNHISSNSFFPGTQPARRGSTASHQPTTEVPRELC